jgi:hypothetical protein
MRSFIQRRLGGTEYTRGCSWNISKRASQCMQFNPGLAVTLIDDA